MPKSQDSQQVELAKQQLELLKEAAKSYLSAINPHGVITPELVNRVLRDNLKDILLWYANKNSNENKSARGPSKFE